jgi:hypothetical protein
MLRAIMAIILLVLSGCALLSGVDDKGNPTGPGGKGLLDLVGEVAGATVPVYGGIAAAVLGIAGVKLRSYLIKKAGRKDDNGNGVPDDIETPVK